MNANRSQAIVISRTNYGEADRIINFITPVGKISLIAKAVRRETSRLASGVELLTLSDITYVRGKGSIGTLTSAKPSQIFGNIITDYDRLQFTYEMLKYISQASEGLDSADWFNLTEETIVGINNKQINLDIIKTWFYLKCASLMGHELNLSNDSNGAKLRSGAIYDFDTWGKDWIENSSGQINSAHIKYLRILSSKPLKTVAQIGGVENILPTCLKIAMSQAGI